ncbi:hypothetical protein QYE76_039034 [Lolium multiflorum]|uniref:Retrotransposon gag domain-containing protein n=1 Tax=Lolium multiflorum TaxID=4521 RepID=A0AAD8T959_LOLMU|nr:hypothetical protein QYE76_039034 [Lolium multiflorum]
MTWADFKLKFSKYHVPPGLIKKMRDEFRELKQGRPTVVEYRDKFLTLSRRQQGRLKRRLHPPKSHRHSHRAPEPSQRKPRDGRTPHNSNNFVHHNNNFNRARQEPPTPTPTLLQTGSNAVPVAPKDKSTINCYECGVLGHYSKSVPSDSPRWPPTPLALSSNAVSPTTRSSPTTRTTAAAASFT